MVLQQPVFENYLDEYRSTVVSCDHSIPLNLGLEMLKKLDNHFSEMCSFYNQVSVLPQIYNLHSKSLPLNFRGLKLSFPVGMRTTSSRPLSNGNFIIPEARKLGRGTQRTIYVPKSLLRKVASFPKLHNVTSAGLERDSFFHSLHLFLRHVIPPIPDDALANEFAGYGPLPHISHSVL